MEKCPREESFSELYPLLGDKAAQDSIRSSNPDILHCPWLRRDPNACISLPEGIEGHTSGTTCPHNVYVNQASVFENRDAVIDTIDRLLRLNVAGEVGLLNEESMDPLSVTELLTTKNELQRQQNEREHREYERSKLEAETNKGKSGINTLGGWDT